MEELEIAGDELPAIPKQAKFLAVVVLLTVPIRALDLIFMPADLRLSIGGTIVTSILALAVISWIIFEITRGKRNARIMIFVIMGITAVFFGFAFFAEENLRSVLFSFSAIETLLWVGAAILCETPPIKGWLVR